ncbi:hypothetical protein ABEB36_007951 [Hypothenemus hampei]|uniref:Uncharacterized protein n=1 Tax=Hypothenemus hampei TaxID=57062 RepID=A0ABD1EVP6_HYPHA
MESFSDYWNIKYNISNKTQTMKIENLPKTETERKVSPEQSCRDNQSLDGKKPSKNYEHQPDWWTEEIAEKRKNCIKMRRRMTRTNAKKDTSELEKNAKREDFKAARRELKKTIRIEKERVCS